MDELEELAAELVVVELGAVSYVRRDVPGAPGKTRDFDIVFADGHEEPLEVTTNLDTRVMVSLDRTDDGILAVAAAVQRMWIIPGAATWTDAGGHTQPFDRKRVGELLPPIIEQIEREGETTLDIARLAWPIAYGRKDLTHAAAAQELHNFGITHGSSIEPPPDLKPGISIHVGGGGGYGRETLTREIEEIAARPDNVAKLATRGDADRRHLFVALSGRGSTGMSAWALQSYIDGWAWDEEPPLPTLPDAITTIWAGTRTGGIYTTPDGWRRFGSARS